MENNKRLNDYCKRVIQRLGEHPYFMQTVSSDGTVDLGKFQSRYRNLLDEVQTIDRRPGSRYALTPREKEMLLVRAGVEGYHTTEKVGRRIGVTDKRIRQLETRAFRFLRRIEESGRLLDMLYLREFNSLTGQGIESEGFDAGYVQQARVSVEKVLKIREGQVGRGPYSAEYSI